MALNAACFPDKPLPNSSHLCVRRKKAEKPCFEANCTMETASHQEGEEKVSLDPKLSTHFADRCLAGSSSCSRAGGFDCCLGFVAEGILRGWWVDAGLFEQQHFVALERTKLYEPKNEIILFVMLKSSNDFMVTTRYMPFLRCLPPCYQKCGRSAANRGECHQTAHKGLEPSLFWIDPCNLHGEPVLFRFG